MRSRGEMKLPIARVALLLGIVVPGAFVAGCVHAPPVARPYPAPTPDALAAALAARQQAVAGMSARVRATSWLGGERVRATVNMLVERDGHLRFEAEVSLQGTVATLATDGATFALLDARKNELSRGPACPANTGFVKHNCTDRMLDVIRVARKTMNHFVIGTLPERPHAE